MKIKNLLMQWFVLTPLTAIQSAGGCGIILFFTDSASSGISMIIIMLIVCFLLSKLILKIKGKEVNDTYWDSDFEYELNHESGNRYSLKQTKGGWTTTTKFTVFLYMLISPITVFLQLIANIFVVVAFFNKRIASWYGAIDYDTLSHPILQRIIHFLFSIVILDEGYELKK